MVIDKPQCVYVDACFHYVLYVDACYRQASTKPTLHQVPFGGMIEPNLVILDVGDRTRLTNAHGFVKLRVGSLMLPWRGQPKQMAKNNNIWKWGSWPNGQVLEL